MKPAHQRVRAAFHQRAKRSISFLNKGFCACRLALLGRGRSSPRLVTVHDSQAQLTEHAQRLSKAHIPHTGVLVSEWSAENVAAALEAHPDIDQQVGCRGLTVQLASLRLTCLYGQTLSQLTASDCTLGRVSEGCLSEALDTPSPSALAAIQGRVQRHNLWPWLLKGTHQCCANAVGVHVSAVSSLVLSIVALPAQCTQYAWWCAQLFILNDVIYWCPVLTERCPWPVCRVWSGYGPYSQHHWQLQTPVQLQWTHQQQPVDNSIMSSNLSSSRVSMAAGLQTSCQCGQRLLGNTALSAWMLCHRAVRLLLRAKLHSSYCCRRQSMACYQDQARGNTLAGMPAVLAWLWHSEVQPGCCATAQSGPSCRTNCTAAVVQAESMACCQGLAQDSALAGMPATVRVHVEVT